MAKNLSVDSQHIPTSLSQGMIRSWQFLTANNRFRYFWSTDKQCNLCARFQINEHCLVCAESYFTCMFTWVNLEQSAMYVQLLCIVSGVLSTAAVIVSTFWNVWAISSPESAAVLGAIWSFKGLWGTCVQATGGHHNCREQASLLTEGGEWNLHGWPRCRLKMKLMFLYMLSRMREEMLVTCK